VPLSRQAPSSRSRSKVGASVILPMRVSRLNASPVRGPDILTSGRARCKEVQEHVVGFGPSVDKILNTRQDLYFRWGINKSLNRVSGCDVPAFTMQCEVLFTSLEDGLMMMIMMMARLLN